MERTHGCELERNKIKGTKLVNIRKNELVELSKALAFARDFIPDTAIWGWDKKSSWGEMHAKASKIVFDLQVKRREITKKQTLIITQKRKDDPMYKQKHNQASKRYYERKKQQMNAK